MNDDSLRVGYLATELISSSYYELHNESIMALMIVVSSIWFSISLLCFSRFLQQSGSPKLVHWNLAQWHNFSHLPGGDNKSIDASLFSDKCQVPICCRPGILFDNTWHKLNFRTASFLQRVVEFSIPYHDFSLDWCKPRRKYIFY